MAGVYFILGVADAERLQRVGSYMRFGSECEVSHSGEISYVWMGFDEEAKYAPAFDPVTKVHVVTSGRTVWSAVDWRRGEELPYEGGVASRLLLDRFLQGKEFVAPYDGASAVLIWDPRSKAVHLWTDQLGYHPAFVYNSSAARETIFTSFPDALLADPRVQLSPDETSSAEFLRAWRITPPNTYYSEVKYAGAATHTIWSLATGVRTQATYWRPFEDGFFPSLGAAAESLASAVTEAIRARTACVNSAVFFVSGGADSRTLLYASEDSSKITGINLFERRTPEADIAKELCDRRGVRYVGFQRDSDYYPRMLKENVRWSGGMWSAEDSHYLGTRSVVAEAKPDLVMTACTTDWLLKGYGLERTHMRLAGRNLPLKRFVNARVDGFLPNYPSQAPAEYSRQINSRMDAWFDGTPKQLNNDIDHLLVEDRRIRPACYTVSVSGQMMYRTFPYDTFLADSRIAQCYAKIRASWKLNGEVWGLAANRICSDARDIADANYGWRLDASRTEKLFHFGANWIRRKLKKSSDVAGAPEDGHPPSHASWPEYGWYATHSATVRDMWLSAPVGHRQRMKGILGRDAWEVTLEEWAGDAGLFFRILTLLAHWRIQEEAGAWRIAR